MWHFSSEISATFQYCIIDNVYLRFGTNPLKEMRAVEAKQRQTLYLVSSASNRNKINLGCAAQGLNQLK